MADKASLPYSVVGLIPIGQTDGNIVIPGTVKNLQASSADPSIVAASIAPDGVSLCLVPAAMKAGSALVTVTGDGLKSWDVEVEVTVPVANALYGNVAALTTQPFLPPGADAVPVSLAASIA
jgi:hypothetical protein